ncbi:hypothetical protein ACLD9W_00785, partial [Neisseria sp. WLZKY-1]|uniref:hypothetical protein n=1 Tax=Neisseria sp. WLZKY-1 TaxID=3390377 RepID=UPI00397D6AAF
RNRQPMLNIFCLFLSQCEARALTLIGNRFVKEQRCQSSEDVNYTEPRNPLQAFVRKYFERFKNTNVS